MPQPTTKSSSGHCTSLARVRTLAVTRITASPCARVQYKQIEILQRGRLQDWKITNEIKETYEANNQGFSFKTVSGHHQIHMTHPERVWSKIQEFLENTKEAI